MEHLCSKLLLRIGKVIPFVLAFIVLVGYVENVYSVLTDRICIDEYGMVLDTASSELYSIRKQLKRVDSDINLTI